MRSRNVIIIAIIAMAVICGLVKLLMPDEPRYQGKCVSEWLHSLDKSPVPIRVDVLSETTVVDTNHPAVQAIMHIGSEVVPILVKELRTRDSAAKLWLMKLLRKQSVIRIDLTLSNVRHARAIQACAVLGPSAKATLPELSKLLSDTKLDPRTASLPRVLALMGPDALPAIIAALTNRDAQVRWLMAGALQQVGFDAEGAVPALVTCVKETQDYRVPCMAALALAHIRKRPDLVLPALTNNLSNTNYYIRRFSAQRSSSSERQHLGYDNERTWKRI